MIVTLGKHRHSLQAVVLLVSHAFVLTSAVPAVLPEDRTDLLYHLYDGGGARIDGPAVLVRKGFSEKLSISGKYYVDTVSSASIDVVTTASPYKEDRQEISVGANYLYDATLFNLSYTSSDEDDFNAESVFFNLSQEMFGALTTVTLGYGIGNDEVGRNGDSGFAAKANRQHYQLGVSQVLSKSWVMALDFEAITDEGYLNNPYRSVRYLDTASATGYSYESEVYPNTRTSTAVALKSSYYLSYGAALSGNYRYFTDTWNIDAHTIQLKYIHKFGDQWIAEAGYRFYTQTAAEFYADLFERPQAQNFLARDKELSSFTDHTLRVGVSYEFATKRFQFIDRGTLNLFYNHIEFDYDNFRNLTSGGAPGEEALYGFGADVFQIYLSVWY